MASGQNTWDDQPPRSFPSSTSASSSGNGESGQGERKFFLKAVAIPYKYGGPPLDGGSSSQAAQTSEDRRHENSGARPAFTIPTPVTTTSSTATRVRHGPRHVFSTAHKEYLESNFQRRSYPDKAEVEDMADKLSVTEDKIRNWFTNRRFKEKRTTEAEVPSRETSPVQIALTRSTLSSVSIGPQAQNLATRSIVPHHKSLTLSSEREENSSADGVLGSIKYRPSAQQVSSLSSSKPSLDKAQANKADSSKKMNSSQVVTSISSFLKGGSIARKEDVHQLAKIMAMAGDWSGRKYILIALNSTKSQQIHDELAKSPGLAMIVDWIKEARKGVDILDDSNDSDQEARKVLLHAIHVLGRAPAEQRQDFMSTIKSLTNDQKYPTDIVKAASDLLATWTTKTGDRNSSRSGASQPQVDGRKRARMDSGPVGGFSEDLSMLPKFTKKSASESAPKNTSSSSTATTSSSSYTSASLSSSSSSSSTSSTPTAKGGPSSRRIDRSSLPLSVLTGRNLPLGTAVPASPHSSKAVSSPYQPYSPRGALTSSVAQSPRSANSPKTSQGASSSTATDKVLERQKDFFSIISVPSKVTSTISSTTAATASASAPTTPTAAKPPAAITTTTTTTTKAVKGPGIVLPDGKHLASALVLKHASTKKVVRFRGGDDIQEVRIVPNRDDEQNWDYQGDYLDYDHDRDRDHNGDLDDHGDGDDYYYDDNNHDHGSSHERNNDRGRDYRDEDERRSDYDRGDGDPYRQDRHDDRDRGREYEQGHGHGHEHGYDQGRGQGYDEKMHEPGYDHEYEHRREHQYDHGQGHGYEREYEHGHRQEPPQDLQHPQYFQEPNAFSETASKEEGPDMPKMPTVPTFRLPEEDVEMAVLGNFWRPPRPLLIQHPFDQSHKEPATFGEESEEKKVQEEREAIVAGVQYLDLASIPPSPAEPDDDGLVDPRPERKIGLYEIEADYHKVAIPMLSMFLQVIQARRKEMGR